MAGFKNQSANEPQPATKAEPRKRPDRIPKPLFMQKQDPGLRRRQNNQPLPLTSALYLPLNKNSRPKTNTCRRKKHLTFTILSPKLRPMNRSSRGISQQNHTPRCKFTVDRLESNLCQGQFKNRELQMYPSQKSCCLIFTLAIIFAITSLAPAELWLPSIFSSNMVIQQKQPCKIWGRTENNAPVTITPSWLSTPQKTTADATGQWQNHHRPPHHRRPLPANHHRRP